MTLKKIALLFVCLFLGFSRVVCTASDIADEATPVTDSDASRGSGQGHSSVEEIIVVCKTHFDIGYTHRIDELIPYYRTTMIDKALAVMEQSKGLPKSQQFIWTAPAWVMSQVLGNWEGQTRQRKERLEAAFKSGRFVAHALPFTSHSDIMSPEEFARSGKYSVAVSQEYGLPLPRAAKVTDVPSHSFALATGLAHSGIRFLHIGCNWPSGNVDYPGLFWWEGPDGSRMLTLYSSIYGSCTALWPRGWGGGTGDDHPGIIGTNFLPPTNWPHKVWLAILVTPDNSGPPKADALKPLFDEIAEEMPGVTIRMGQMEEFAEAIIKSGAKLPVVTKEAPDTWIHGVMSDPGGIKLYRHLQPLASSAEVLNTQLQLSKVPAENATHLFDEANEQRLLYAEHTWGVGQGVRVYGKEFHDQPAGTYKNLEGSWEDKTNYIRRADTLIRSQLASDLTSLAKAIDCEGKRFVVYNPLPWKRSEMIEIPGTGGMNYFAEDVPGNGYKCFSFAKVRSSATENATSDSIENAYYKISFDPDRGTIKSLVNKKTGKDWISTDVTEGLGHYVNERFTFEQCLDYTKKYQNERAMGCLGMAEDEDWPHPGINKPGMISEKGVPYRIASPHRGTVTITRTNGAQTAVLTMKAEPDRFLPASELRVRLESGMPYVEITCKIIDKPKDNWPEADWLCLPFNIKNPTFSIARALGTINPARDLLPGSNRHLYSVGSGVTITDSDGSGVAVCPIDHPLVSLGEPGMWQFSRDYCPVQSTVYVNLYNNMWNTNFRYWYPGTWESRVRIWTFEKQSHAEKRFQIAGLEARNPLLVAVADGDGGHMPMQKPGIVASRKGITITALRAPLSLQGKTGDNVLFRIWERAGQAGELTISFPPEMKYSQASPVNLRGEPAGDSLPIKHGTLFIQIGKYAPASFILKGLSQ